MPQKLSDINNDWKSKEDDLVSGTTFLNNGQYGYAHFSYDIDDKIEYFKFVGELFCKNCCGSISDNNHQASYDITDEETSTLSKETTEKVKTDITGKAGLKIAKIIEVGGSVDHGWEKDTGTKTTTSTKESIKRTLRVYWRGGHAAKCKSASVPYGIVTTVRLYGKITYTRKWRYWAQEKEKIEWFDVTVDYSDLTIQITHDLGIDDAHTLIKACECTQCEEGCVETPLEPEQPKTQEKQKVAGE